MQQSSAIARRAARVRAANRQSFIGLGLLALVAGVLLLVMLVVSVGQPNTMPLVAYVGAVGLLVTMCVASLVIAVAAFWSARP